MIDACPPPPHVVTVSRPLSIGLPYETFVAVISGSKSDFTTKKNPRKDRYFSAKRPAQARITSLETGQSVLRDIKCIEETPEAWRVFI